MEKKFSGLSICLFIIVSFLAVSCTDSAEEAEIRKPDISISDGKITLSIARESDAKYINIYRRESPDGTEPVNIGEIIPTEVDEKIAYIFEDNFFISNTKYEYCVRYRFSDGYSYTDWSDPVSADNGFTSEDDLKYSAAGAYLKYNASTCVFTVAGGNITAPADLKFTDFSPVFIIQASDKARTFPLKLSAEDIAEGTEIDMRSILSSDFFDTDLKLVGILYEKVDSESDKSYTKIYWGLPLAVSIKDDSTAETPLTVFRVTFEAANNNDHDYTPFGLSRAAVPAADPVYDYSL